MPTWRLRGACLALALAGCTRHEVREQRFGQLVLQHTISWTPPSPRQSFSLTTVRLPGAMWTPEGTTRVAQHEGMLAVFSGGSYAEAPGPARLLLLFNAATGEALPLQASCIGLGPTPLGPALGYLNQAPTMMPTLEAFERDAVLLREGPGRSRVLTQVFARGREAGCADFPLHAKYPYLVHVERLRSGDVTVGACPDEVGDRSRCVHLWLRANTAAEVVTESEVVALRARAAGDAR